MLSTYEIMTLIQENNVLQKIEIAKLSLIDAERGPYFELLEELYNTICFKNQICKYPESTSVSIIAVSIMINNILISLHRELDFLINSVNRLSVLRDEYHWHFMEDSRLIQGTTAFRTKKFYRTFLKSINFGLPYDIIQRQQLTDRKRELIVLTNDHLDKSITLNIPWIKWELNCNTVWDYVSCEAEGGVCERDEPESFFKSTLEWLANPDLFVPDPIRFPILTIIMNNRQHDYSSLAILMHTNKFPTTLLEVHNLKLEKPNFAQTPLYTPPFVSYE
jgi:hypothetical protein